MKLQTRVRLIPWHRPVVVMGFVTLQRIVIRVRKIVLAFLSHRPFVAMASVKTVKPANPARLIAKARPKENPINVSAVPVVL